MWLQTIKIGNLKRDPANTDCLSKQSKGKMWVKPYNLSASGCSHLSIPLSHSNFTSILLFIVFNSSPQNIIFFSDMAIFQQPLQKSSCLVSSLLHASFPPAAPHTTLEAPHLHSHSLIPRILLLQSSSVEAQSLTNSLFPRLA